MNKIQFVVYNLEHITFGVELKSKIIVINIKLIQKVKKNNHPTGAPILFESIH